MGKVHSDQNHCKMVRDKRDICPSIMERKLRFLGKSWSIMIIGTLGNYKKLRYVELKNKLGRISPKTLVTRLKELETIGLVDRTAFAEIPPRVVYKLTTKGQTLYRRLIPLIEWTN